MKNTIKMVYLFQHSMIFTEREGGERERECVCACVRACACVRVCACARARARVCVRENSYAGVYSRYYVN
jgi:hypothetical protein